MHAAVQLGWSGVRISHASCPLSKAVRDLPEPNRSHCARWKRAVFKWFERHAEVDTLVRVPISAGSGVVPTARAQRVRDVGRRLSGGLEGLADTSSTSW